MTSNDFAKSLLMLSQQLQAEVDAIALPPSDIEPSREQAVLPIALFKNCQRKYIQKVVYQINRTYSETCYDACAVMMRRLIETLIIEVFEQNQIDHKIKKASGEFSALEELINAVVAETSWNISRNSKRAFDKVKRLGDQSAHNRRWNAHREYVDELKDELRVVSHELLALGKMI